MAVNALRPFTSDAEQIAIMTNELAAAAGFKIDGYINNTNLLEETTAEMVAEGEKKILDASAITGIPLVANCVMEGLDIPDGMLKTELLTALQPAFAKISEMGIRYSAIPGHTTELADALNEVLSKKWKELRGIEIVSFGVSSIKADEEDEKTLKELQKAAAYTNPNLAAAAMVNATSNAMQTAAGNSGGAAIGFMGMNMAQQAGGINAQNLYAMGAQQQAQQQAAPAPAAVAGWDCACGQKNITGNFCPECGAKRPETSGWTCSCGTVNQGKFCTACGAAKPAGAPQYKCDKCGWMPEDPANPPKFCPECGDPFGDEDLV
jgi:membrane protease subunit (stomatin/prohibitin family)